MLEKKTKKREKNSKNSELVRTRGITLAKATYIEVRNSNAEKLI